MVVRYDRVWLCATLACLACSPHTESSVSNSGGGVASGGANADATTPASTGGGTGPAPAGGSSGGPQASGGSSGGSPSGGSTSADAGASSGGGSSGGASGGPAVGPSDAGLGAPRGDAAVYVEPDGSLAGTTPGLTAPGDAGDGYYQITTYPVDPVLTAGASPAGKRFNFNLTGSKLYPATASRAITVYVPNLYKDGTAAPVMVVMDGAGSQFLRVQAGLDNLSQSTYPTRRVPPFILVAVASGQRSIELDTMSDLWARYIDEEVFPAVVSNAAIKAAYPNIAITKDPEGRGAVGCSSGGSAAIIMAWFRPDLFRRAIGYDASLVNLQSSTMYPLGAWDLHSDLALILNSPVEPIRIVGDDNEMDNGAGTGEAGAKDWLLAGQRTAADLSTMGYHYRWLEGMGAMHCSDARVQQTSMGDSLVWVWRGYPN